MQTGGVIYNTIYDEGDFTTEYKVNIDGIDFDQSKIWSLNTSRKLFSENGPMIGSAMVGSIDLTVTNIGVDFSRRAKIIPYIRIRSKKNTSHVSPWIQKGEFFIDTRNRDNSDYSEDVEKITIQGYDAMRKGNQAYPSSNLIWNATNPNCYKVVCEIAGFLFDVPYYYGYQYIEDETSAKLQATQYVVGFPAQYTINEVLGSIAAMYGGNFCISDTGKLSLIGLMDLPEETHYLINEKGHTITFGGNRIVLIAPSQEQIEQQQDLSVDTGGGDDPSVSESSTVTWTKGSGAACVIYSAWPLDTYAYFLYQVSGSTSYIAIPAEKYALNTENRAITLAADWLETLAVGTYEICGYRAWAGNVTYATIKTLVVSQ